MRVVFFGNCQMQALRAATTLFAVPHTGDSVEWHFCAKGITPELREAVARADVLVDQISQMPQRHSVEGLETRARRLRVPAVGANFLWPFAGTSHPDSVRKHGVYNPFFGEMGDAWLVGRLNGVGDYDAAVADYMALDVAREARLDRRYEMGLETQAFLERETPYRFADLIAAHIRTERLFRTPYHIEGRLFRHMVAVFFGELGVPEAARRAVEKYLVASTFGPKELPMHPAVAAHFGLRWAGPDTRYRFNSEAMLSFEEWAHRFARCEAYPAVTRAVTAVQQGWPNAARLLRDAAAQLPDSALVRHAQATLLIRAGKHRAAVSTLQALARAFPALPGVHADMFECLAAMKLDKAAERAMRAEIALRPAQRSLYTRLARFLRERGQAPDAELACALALAPDAPMDLESEPEAEADIVEE
jgi:hypothetical protein